MASTRVYKLAKELGVKSSAIVNKCKDEDLPVKNHMSVISAGLAATIREWFSEGENVTTVETAGKVDLEKVRVRKKPKRTPPKKKAAQAEAQPAAEEVETKAEEAEEPEAAAPEVEAAEPAPPKTEKARKVAEAPTEQAPAVEEPAQEEEEKPTEESPDTTEPQAKPTPKTEPEVKKKPSEAKKEEKPKEEPIVPVGPIMDKPEPAKLSGPQVVRIEEPEPIRPSRPRSRPRYDAPITQPLMPGIEPAASGPSTGKRGGKRKDRTHGRRKDDKAAGPAGKGKRGGKWRQRDIEERKARLSAAGGEGLRLRPTRRVTSKAQREAASKRRPSKATVSEPVTVKDLSAALAVKASEIIAKLMQQGVMATANQAISNEAAELIALEFDVELEVVQKASLDEEIREEFEKRERKNLKKRSVVAAMLGHVDHGKTSLLDKIRSTQVADGEAGGITQHIGASQITFGGKKVTFLDTPGHEAFTAMRTRGANMTDVVVLVVAADDGVMPQTAEAIAHCKAANVPILVALNKIDLPGCDINRIYAQLAEHELVPTEWGGDTDVVKTSATTGEGVTDLLEHLDLMGELLEFKADDSIPATGWVVEAKMSSQRGPTATLLIKEGVLKKGDVVLAGEAYGRVKQLRDSFSNIIKKATSSTPVEIIGLSDVPQAGERFYCLEDINRAKAVAEETQAQSRESSLAERTQVTLDNLFSQIEAGKAETLNLIIRADVQGSVDVLKKYLSDLSTEEVKIAILHAAPGGITEGDVVLAEASNAIIIGFNVVADEQASRTAEACGVEIRLYNVIYRITEDLQQSMVGMLAPEEKEESLGRAVVRQTFKISRLGTVAGCYVTSGVAAKRAKARLIRDNVVIKDDLHIETLKHFKDDAREVKTGLECGIKIAKFDDIKVDDVLEFYEIVKVARTLS